MKLGTRGELLFEDGETWLPVSRYWILSMGLLGRYGTRADRGVHFKFTERMIRPDLSEQRIWSSRPRSPSGSRRATDQLPLRGQPTLTAPPPLTQIWGTTGSFRLDLASESSRESIGNKDRLRFELDTEYQLGPLPSGNSAGSDWQNLPFMFWLAIGFLPCNIGGHEIIASLDVHLSSELLVTRKNSFNQTDCTAD